MNCRDAYRPQVREKIERPRIVSFNTPLICLQRFLLPKVLLLQVTTLQDYLHFKAGLKIENII